MSSRLAACNLKTWSTKQKQRLELDVSPLVQRQFVPDVKLREIHATALKRQGIKTGVVLPGLHSTRIYGTVREIERLRQQTEPDDWFIITFASIIIPVRVCSIRLAGGLLHSERL